MKDNIEVALLEKFNTREPSAFVEVYSLYYKELLHYASKIYRNTSCVSCDIIQDVFMKIWQSKRSDFENLLSIKAYLYMSIKNSFKDYIGHQTYVNKYADIIVSEDQYSIDIIESETYSLVSYAIDLLPEECADVFKLHIEGWSMKEISEKLNKSERTIYSRKNEAIEILKQKMKKDELMILVGCLFLLK